MPPRLDSYFEQYCDYTGGLGIGFVPSHTYDYRFRQRLKKTSDPEIKRLYVLQHLHHEVEADLRDFKAGIVWTGKSSTRPFTPAERISTRESILSKINDLAAYSAFTNFATASFDPLDRTDSSDDARWIQDLRDRLIRVTNAPITTP